MIQICTATMATLDKLRLKGWSVCDLTAMGDICMLRTKHMSAGWRNYFCWLNNTGHIAGPTTIATISRVNHGRYASYGYPGVPCDPTKRKGFRGCKTKQSKLDQMEYPSNFYASAATERDTIRT